MRRPRPAPSASRIAICRRASNATREEEIRDVRARDDQYEADEDRQDNHEHHGGLALTATEAVAVEHHEPRLRPRRRIDASHLGCDRVELRLCFGSQGAGRQTTNQTQTRSGAARAPITGKEAVGGFQRDPDVDWCPDERAGEPRGRYSDDGIRMAVEKDCRADRPTTGEMPRLGAPADHGNGGCAASIVSRRQEAAARRRRVQDGEVIGGDNLAERFCVVVPGANDERRERGRNGRERTAARADITVVRVREREASGLLAATRAAPHADETVWFEWTQGPEENGVRERIDGEVRADPDGQRQHRHKDEARSPREGPDDVSQVSHQSISGAARSCADWWRGRTTPTIRRVIERQRHGFADVPADRRRSSSAPLQRLELLLEIAERGLARPPGQRARQQPFGQTFHANRSPRRMRSSAASDCRSTRSPRDVSSK